MALTDEEVLTLAYRHGIQAERASLLFSKEDVIAFAGVLMEREQSAQGEREPVEWLFGNSFNYPVWIGLAAESWI